MKIRVNLDDQETRAAWGAALAAKAEVASWPPWKRGEDVSRGDDADLAGLTAQQALDRGILVRP